MTWSVPGQRETLSGGGETDPKELHVRLSSNLHMHAYMQLLMCVFTHTHLNIHKHAQTCPQLHAHHTYSLVLSTQSNEQTTHLGQRVKGLVGVVQLDGIQCLLKLRCPVLEQKFSSQGLRIF